MKTILAALGALCVLAVLPLAGLPEYYVSISITAFLFTVCAVGLNVVYGYLGLLSIAQAAFWGIGGYAAAILVMDYGFSFWSALAMAGVLNAVLALIIGYPALRLSSHSFVIVTLYFSLLVTLVSRDWTEVTRGPLGIPGLPAPDLFGYKFTTQVSFYYLSLVFMAVAIAFFYAFCSSRIGLVLRSIKQSEPLAKSQGVRTKPYKLLAFSVSAFFTAMAGAIFSFRLTLVDPLIFDFYYMQAFLTMVIVGGAGTFWPVVVAGFIVTFIPELLRFSNELRMVLFGVLLVAVVLVAPNGFGGWLKELRLKKLRAEFR